MTDRLTAIEIELAFRRPLVTSRGTFATRRSVLVQLESEGLIGWGEAPAFPSGRFGSAFEAFADLAEPEGWKGHQPSVPIARAGLEAARADAAARAEGRPLHEWLGASGTAVAARHPIGVLDPSQVESEAAWLESHGIEAVKLKITPGNDVLPVAGLRAALPNLDIGVDANAGYRDPHLDVFDHLADAGISFIEQPFPSDDLESHRTLRERLAPAVCLDESIRSVADVEDALEAGAADQVSIKLNRHGLAVLRKALALAASRDVGVRIGGTFDTSIGRRHLLAASGLRGVVDAAVGPPSAYLCEDVAEYPQMTQGEIAPSSSPGLGVAPSPEAIDRLEIRRATVEI